jgi:hypothetical protein
MSSAAQIAANQANAQFSTGPVTEAGKAASSQNRRIHGFTGRFALLAGEDPAEFQAFNAALVAEHQPTTPTEAMLVEKMAQHFWTAQRATRLQAISFGKEGHEKQLALYLRYQTTHDREFHKCLSTLLKLRAERRKALADVEKQKIGFESQKRIQAEEARKQELHEAKIRLLNAKAQDQELDTEIRAGIEAPMPGHTRIPFETLKSLYKEAFTQTGRQEAA